MMSNARDNRNKAILGHKTPMYLIPQVIGVCKEKILFCLKNPLHDRDSQ